MPRSIVFISCLLALIISPISLVIAFEMEGVIDRPAAVVQTRLASAGFAGTKAPSIDYSEFNAVLPLKPTCDRPHDIIRIRRVELCRITLDQAPVRVPGVIRYRVLVEKGLEDQAAGFITRVAAILTADTGWVRNGVRFTRVVENYDLTVVLAEPGSVDRLCRPLRTGGWLSCAMDGRAIINAKRWREGAKTWGDDVAGYHHYLINHEVGHVLGLHHANCPGRGEPAPIMLPQTRFLAGCTANGAATPRDLEIMARVLPELHQRFSAAQTRDNRRYQRRAGLSRAAVLSRLGGPKRRSRSKRRRR